MTATLRRASQGLNSIVWMNPIDGFYEVRHGVRRLRRSWRCPTRWTIGPRDPILGPLQPRLTNESEGRTVDANVASSRHGGRLAVRNCRRQRGDTACREFRPPAADAWC